MIKLATLMTLLVTLGAAYDAVAAHEPWIRHSSFEDFAAGTLGNGGDNLYVARSGRVEMIHRWDFNTNN